MAEAISPMPIPRSFMSDMPATSMQVGLSLMTRRSNALADFWRSCAEVREPADLMAVQLNFWTQLVDDYQEALNESLSQISATPTTGETAAR
jgi:hypothetical protein